MEKLVFIFQIIILAALIGCTDAEFSQKPPRLVKQEVNAGKVDILFVVDNSGSMYTEQKKMADAFPQFVQGIDINGLDYRVGIITTDVTSSRNPQKSLAGLEKGALQDGRLIKFGNGKVYLDNSDYDNGTIQSHFRRSIQRQETLDCENAGFVESKCPSGDERGIYAAIKAVDRNEGGFFRSGSHIAFVFLTDEDERGLGLAAFDIPNYPNYLLPTRGDYPTTLIEYVRGRLGEGHTMSAHAIVTNNESCRQAQVYQEGNQYIWGQIGHFYMRMANPGSTSLLNSGVSLSSISGGKLLSGTIGSICASNYSSQVGSIRTALNQASFRNVSSKDLDCKVEPDTFQADYCPPGHSCRLANTGDKVIFSPPLPPSEKAKFSYFCP